MGNHRHDLTLPKEYLTRDKARLLYVTSATYGGDWLSTPHTHYCSELFYVLDGVGQFQIEDKIFPVAANDLIIINPDVLHTELGFNANPLKYIVLGIEGLELSAKEKNTNFCIVNLKEIKESVNFYLKMMVHEIEARSPGYETICQDLMEILVVLLGRQTNFSTVLAPVNKKVSPLCTSVRRYMDANFSEDITLEQLADFSHVNKYYLAHAFTEEFGIPPIQYLINARIEKAKNLLATTDYPQALISRSCGFSSASHFSQTFKRLTGMSPGIYRKNSKSDSGEKETYKNER